MESSSLLLSVIEYRCLYKLFIVIFAILILSPLIMVSIDCQLRPPPPTTTTRRPTFLSPFIIRRSPNFPPSIGSLRGRGSLLLPPSSFSSPISSRFIEIVERFVTTSTIKTTTPKPIPLPFTTKNMTIENDRMCKQSDMDLCSQRMLMITDRNFHYPVTMAEMDQRCRELKPIEKCVRHYSQHCFESNIQQKTFSLIIYGVTKTNRALCRNKRRRRAFVEFGQQCANRLQKTLITYVEEMYSAMFAILKYPIRKLRIPLSCW
ncbi:hypothetical protein BLA29_002207 [Euroglyphus maynei]|uniref:Uncharacterized protein n=1 Tax=Euroglyphus maynei TaxID=6958 RepID=A0A1Y3APK5_EURMA|nr:hypothetical protein BLA29_002207 [Euroglyphus maynei]